MKSYKYVVSLVLLFTISSCSDFLDRSPDAQLTLDMVFRDKTRTEDWLAGIYTNIPDPYWGYANSIGYDPLSDDMAPSTRWLPEWGWNVVQLQNGNWNVSTHWPPNYWHELPRRIRSAYIFLENARPNVAQKVPQEEVDLMKYEARFLISYYYWLMAEAYGAIPFKPGLTPGDASGEELYIGQTPFDQVIDWVDAELLELSQKLPAHYSDQKKYGRATSIMCLAVRARMLLFAASPLVNGNTDYNDFVNNKGEKLFNTSYDAGKWLKATTACKQLIDAAEAEGHKLYYEYIGGAIDPFLSYQNMMFKKATDGNTEILFARPGSNTWEYDKHAQPRGTAGNGGLGVTQSLVDAFFMENGLPITDPNSKYVEKGFSTEDEIRTNTNWNEVPKPEDATETNMKRIITFAGTYNMYVKREPRFYISVLYNRAWHRRENRTTRFLLNEWDGGPTHDAPQNGYLLRKKVHPDHNPRENINPYRPGILYRLGEAYLNYAEALNETEPGNPDIEKYVNLIRERAGIPPLTPGLGQEAMRQAIRRERRVELNC